MGDSPAFQFYPSDWLVGTLTLSLSEEGAYLRCLCHQWSTGTLPASDIPALARIMRVTEREAAKLWARIGGKFILGDDGLWRNARLETEREKQAEYRLAKVGAGRRGGLAKAKHKASTATVLPLANTLAKPSSSSSSSSSSSEPPPKNGGGQERVGGGSVMSPAEYDRLKHANAFVGARLRVPHKLHHDFIAALGGVEPDLKLRAWYGAIDEEIEQSGESIAPTVWKWLDVRFKGWITGAAGESEMAKFLSGGAA